jgi:putative component of membrane protein insertase Oxa1/YidC/SpoIIIJ protein YidD
MKAQVLRAIEAWQVNPDRVRGLCRQTPTCSVYGHRAISRYGVLRGGIMTAGRILRCNGCLARSAAAAAQKQMDG